MAVPVTVVVPTRDRLELLRRTLWSVLSQDPEHVVVVDDGSTDATLELVDSLGITSVRGPGGWGAARARNEGLRRVETELVCFVDSDDLLCPRALQQLVDGLSRAPGAPFAYGAGLVALDRGSSFEPYGFIAPSRRELAGGRPALFARNWVPSSGVLARTAAARAAGGYDERLTFSEDHDLWLRLAASGEPLHVPAITVVYRQHPENRHGAARAWDDDGAITALAGSDATLERARAERRGVKLAEAAAEELGARSLSGAARLAVGWLRETERARVARAAARHLRRRRAAAATGRRVWTARPDIVDWLAASRSGEPQPVRSTHRA